ncbi:MAG: AI-2E family transporter [Oscillospiraceae bacterium]
MKICTNKKYNTIALYCIIVFAVCLLLIFAIFKFEWIASFFAKLFHVLSPIIWGIVIAYIFNPFMVFCERHLRKPIEKKKKHPKLVRYLAVTATIIFLLAIITTFISIVFPQIVKSLLKIFMNLGEYFNSAEKFVNTLLDNNPSIKSFVMNEFTSLQSYVMDMVSKLQPQLKEIIENVGIGAYNILIGIKDFILGIIVSVYFLANKEGFKAQIKKFFFAILPQKTCKNMLEIWHNSDKKFTGFISGKLLDSLIIGMLCFIAMSIMDMPFVVLISFIVGVTNMIPFFGPFIGAIPSGILILLENPNKVILFVIFIIILQQFDGNILGPKILGDSTGLPAFWVIFAIIIGGGLFKFVGMLIGVPVFAIIYMLASEIINKQLQKKKLSKETEDYKNGGLGGLSEDIQEPILENSAEISK